MNLPTWLIAAQTALFLVVWLFPLLDFLKHGATVFPVWMHTVAGGGGPARLAGAGGAPWPPRTARCRGSP